MVTPTTADRRLVDRSPLAIDRGPRAGLLLEYQPDGLQLARNAAEYVDKILRGARPSALPVEQASIFDLVINIKTANALGLKIPQSLLLRANEVIQ